MYLSPLEGSSFNDLKFSEFEVYYDYLFTCVGVGGGGGAGVCVLLCAEDTV